MFCFSKFLRRSPLALGFGAGLLAFSAVASAGYSIPGISLPDVPKTVKKTVKSTQKTVRDSAKSVQKSAQSAQKKVKHAAKDGVERAAKSSETVKHKAQSQAKTASNRVSQAGSSAGNKAAAGTKATVGLLKNHAKTADRTIVKQGQAMTSAVSKPIRMLDHVAQKPIGGVISTARPTQPLVASSIPTKSSMAVKLPRITKDDVSREMLNAARPIGKMVDVGDRIVHGKPPVEGRKRRPIVVERGESPAPQGSDRPQTQESTESGPKGPSTSRNSEQQSGSPDGTADDSADSAPRKPVYAQTDKDKAKTEKDKPAPPTIGGDDEEEDREDEEADEPQEVTGAFLKGKK